MFSKALWRKYSAPIPTFPCPECKSVALTLQQDSLKVEETGPSKRARQDDNWDPDWTDKRFVGLLKCHNAACGEVVSVAGSISMDIQVHYDEEGQSHQWSDFYVPAYFDRAPPVFAIPPKCPEEIAKHVEKAFALIWADEGACANRLRVAVETLLDQQSIARKARTKAGKYDRLNLHARIERFKAKNPEVADLLMAIKWIGNSGSHSESVALTRDDLLTGFELFEASLDLLYVNRSERIKNLAKAINKAKGPVRKKVKW